METVLFLEWIQGRCAAGCDLSSWSLVLFCALQDRQLKIKELVLSSHERAVRNCPWTMGLWKSYLVALERHGADHHTVSGMTGSNPPLHFREFSLFRTSDLQERWWPQMV